MRTILINACRLTVLGAVLYGALFHQGGALFLGPAACIGLGLVGLGLCLEARRNAEDLHWPRLGGRRG